MCNTDSSFGWDFFFLFLSDKPVWLHTHPHTHKDTHACKCAKVERWSRQDFSRPRVPRATLSKYRLMIGWEDGSAFHRVSHWLQSPQIETVQDRHLFFVRNYEFEIKHSHCALSGLLRTHGLLRDTQAIDPYIQVNVKVTNTCTHTVKHEGYIKLHKSATLN